MAAGLVLALSPLSQAAHVSGTPGDDHLNGTSQRDRIFGRSGDDTIRARAGADTVRGGAGDDVLLGGRGGDHIELTGGDDLVRGGRGADWISWAYAEVEGGAADIATVRAGRGDDQIVAPDDGGPDHVDCGSGNDVVYCYGPCDPRDTLVGCERTDPSV